MRGIGRSSLAITGVLAGMAMAAPAAKAGSYFAYAQGLASVTADDGTPLDGTQLQNGTFPTDANSGDYAYQSTSAPSMADGVSATMMSAADLQGGQLHAYASMTQPSGTDGFGQSTYVVSEAGFGDSFRAVGANGPFNWASGNATFAMSLDGSATTDSSANGVRLFNVTLTILKPGSLAAGQAFDSDARLGFEDWTYTSYGGFAYLSTSSDPGIVATGSGDLSTGIDLSAAFNFGSDFDWIITLAAGGGSYDSDDVGQILADLSETLTVDYQGPQDTQTVSSSGVFPNTEPASSVPAPEPASLTLMLSGLVGGGLLRRRGKNRLTLATA